MKLTVKSVAAIVAAISISAYGIAVYNTPRITSIHTEAITSLNKGEQGILEIGYETQRGFSAEKSAAAFNKLDFEWETSDENVVTVNDGTVTAVGKGSAIITVTSGQLKAQTEVVVHIPPEDIKADPIVLDTRSGWKDIAYTILPEECDSEAVEFTLDTDIAQLNENNQIQGLVPGESTLEIRVEDISVSVPVKVMRTPNSISASPVSIWAGEKATINVSTDIESPECGTAYSFTSENEDVVSVDENGTVSGIARGNTVIHVKNEFGDTCDVSVNVLDYPLSYSDQTGSVTITKEWYGNAYCYAAHLQFSDYSRFGTNCANGAWQSGSETTSHAASRLNAILCINGDWAAPSLGYRVARGGVVCNDGTCYSEGIYSSVTGVFTHPRLAGVEGATLSSLVSSGTVTDTFQFGPAFLMNGEIAPSGGGRAQRTFIGTNGAPGDIWIVVTEGRGSDGVSAGLTMQECAEFLKTKGCTFGIPLDGGGSTTMVFNGMRLNHASSERAVVDFVYFR